MKKNILALFVALAIIFAGSSSFGQVKPKFGFVDSQELLKAMPERDAAEKTLQTEAGDMQKTLKEMQDEYMKKLQAYDSLVKTGNINGLMKQDKEAELTGLQTRIQTYQQNAQSELQKRESELLQPILEKIQKAIKDVGKENAFTGVFDSAAGILLYYNEEWVDVAPLVKKKLGLVK